ncbi:NAD(P)H-hydrate dehydratase [Pararhodobacter marinus]|uniref:NAD(P)H-hydrate dehydratase n=1 Tax=Pararhodobacter marinus TaxID=2184063 RepID=UPI0035134605
MSDLLTSAQMRATERTAIESGDVTGAMLMERAGAGVVDRLVTRFPALEETRSSGRAPAALILCGPGNNGGDGYVIARLLRARGWAVRVCALGDPGALPADAARNAGLWLESGSVFPLSDAARQLVADPPDLIVDALLGTGLTRPLPPAVRAALQAVEDAHAAHPGLVRVAVDIPSGLCADSGRVLGAACHCDLTVTFHTAKPGHYLQDGATYCSALEIVDIGLDAAPAQDSARLVLPPRDVAKRAGHKYDHGHALILSGPVGRTGAARLAARAALRIGAGLVTLAAPGSAMMECAAQLTAIMLRRCDDAGALAEILSDERLNAVCLGPGMGAGEETVARVSAALRMAETGARGVVLDADALSAFQADPDALFALTANAPRTILTPQFGEFQRLFPDLARLLSDTPETGPAYSRLDAARAAARRAGCIVLLKGADTVIAAPDGTARIHAALYDRAAPWLATAGAGDVLSGLIVGLLARGFAPLDAACMAAWLHVEAARHFGPGLIAEDLPDALPPVLRALGL